jgi:hypothetical protein
MVFDMFAFDGGFFRRAFLRFPKAHREEKLASFCGKVQVGINDDHSYAVEALRSNE